MSFDRRDSYDSLDLDRCGELLTEARRLCGPRVDYVISPCDRVREVCPQFQGNPQTVHWSISDPAAEPGSERETDPAFERTTGELETRIRYFLHRISQREGNRRKAKHHAKPGAPSNATSPTSSTAASTPRPKRPQHSTLDIGESNASCTLQNEWAYARVWTSSTERARSLQSFIRYYNRRRPQRDRRPAAFATSVRPATGREGDRNSLSPQWPTLRVTAGARDG